MPSNLIPSSFCKHFRAERGCPWYGPSAHPGRLGRRQRAPENATHPKTQVTDRPQNLRFRVCCVFGCSLFSLLEENKEHPKTQHTRKRRFWKRSITLGKKKSNKHKEFWRDALWCASRLSRAHVQSVPWCASRLSRGRSVPSVLIYTY